jgi:hypothetical protein
MKRTSTTTTLAALSATALAGSSLFADIAAAQTLSEDWDFRATLYLFYSSIGGEVAPPTGAGAEINLSQDDLMDHLELTGMAAFEVQKGRWGGFADAIYLDIGESKSDTHMLAIGGGTPLPPGVTADVSLDTKAWVVTLTGTYRALSSDATTLDFIAGARLLDIDTTLHYAFNVDFGPFAGPARRGGAEAALSNWDAIIGIRGQLNFGADRAWFARYYADVGTGDSDLTWQAIAGVGYAFGKSEVVMAWRHLDYELASDEKVRNLEFDGPALGFTLRW